MSWDSFCFDVTDFFTTSQAERNRNTYSNLVNKLEYNISEINDQLRTVQENLDQIHRCYRNNGGTNCGRFADEFNKKEQNHEQETRKLLQKLHDASGDLSRKRRQAEQNRDYWQEVVDREDRDKREYNS